MTFQGLGLSDPFKGLREFPRASSQLGDHLNSIHRTLQSNYFVDPETARFALQPEMKNEFYISYRNEVEKIFRHLSKVTNRNIKVRVDPLRSKGGYEVKVVKTSSATSSSSQDNSQDIQEDPEWVEKMRALGRKLQDAERLDSLRQRTPDAEATVMNTSLMDSSVRLHQNSELFRTPPEFMGFKKLEI